MTVFPDSSWLKALEMKGSTAAAVFVASVIILILSEQELLYLQTLPTWVRAIVVVVGILSFAVFSASVWEWGRDKWKMRKQEAQEASQRREAELRAVMEQEDRENEILAYLETLSDTEREILSYLVQRNQQSFTADMAGSRVGTLKQKGLIEMASGVHSAMDWPFTVPNFVWQALQRRREEFNTANLEEAPPWRSYW